MNQVSEFFWNRNITGILFGWYFVLQGMLGNTKITQFNEGNFTSELIYYTLYNRSDKLCGILAKVN